MSLKRLCRLCGLKDELLKDLLDDSNKSVLNLIKDFIHIAVDGNDFLPTMICLNCEEKMVSFQLFILECLKTQEYLYDLCSRNNMSVDIEFEARSEKQGFTVKPEVKDEITEEDIVNAINNDHSLEVLDDHNYLGDDHFDDDDDEDLDNITIATLKQMKKKRKPLCSNEEFDKVVKKCNLKFKDLIKFKCAICGYAFNSWATGQSHYVKEHKCKPVLFCLCGYEIRSKAMVNSHFRQHKQENLMLRRKMGDDLESEDIGKCAKLRVTDFVRFICKTCKEEFTSWYSLMDHTEQTHQQKAVVQCKCGLTLRSKSLLYKHINDHKNPDLLRCDKCPRIAKSMAALEKHMRLKHVPKTDKCFACASCDKAFHSKELLKSHERSHLPIEERKVFSCNVCDMRFTTKSSAASHKRIIHDKVKKYVCDLCGFSCGTGGELRQHRAIHSDDKPFKCDTCSKTFKTYSNLKTHKDTHENTSYSCFVCYRVLNSRRTLRKHLLVHEDKLRHVCSYCNKGFKRRQTLKVHMCTHTGDKPLSCKWCDERFSYASTLRSHRLRCHPDKMAANTQTTQNNVYVYQDNMQQEYNKNIVMDQETLNIAKNEVEAM